ncbi:MAG: hypothetical protein FWF84_04510 [Kiritimatiellaeota bacterium]|nr:hypothetical protein [Kiritimatiellota bacterium]
MKRAVGVVVCWVMGVFVAQGGMPAFVVEVESFEALSSDVVALERLVEQPMLSLALWSGFGPVIGAPGMVGVDQGKPIRAVVYLDMTMFEYDSGKEPAFKGPEVVLIVPVMKDAEPFFSYPHVKRVGDWAIVSPGSEEMVALVAGEFEKDPQAFSVTGVPGTIRAKANGAIVGRVLVGAFEAQIAMMELMIEKFASMGDEGMPSSLSEAMAIQRAFIDPLKRAMAQMKTYTVALQCNMEGGITLYASLEAAEGSMFSKVLAASKAPGETVLRMIPAGALFASADGVTTAFLRHAKPAIEAFGEKIIPLIIKAIDKDATLFNGSLANKDATELWKPLLDALEAYGDDTGQFVVLDADGRAVDVDVTALAPGKVGLEYVERLVTGYGSFLSAIAMPNAPMAIDRKVNRDVLGHTVLSFGMEDKRKMPLDTDDGIVRMTSAIAALFNPKTGVYEFADVDGYLLYTKGEHGAIDPYIAAMKALPTGNVLMDRVKALFPEVTDLDKAVALAHVRPEAFLWAVAASRINAEGELSAIHSLNLDDGDGIAGYATVTAASLSGALRISVSQIKAAVHVISSLDESKDD